MQPIKPAPTSHRRSTRPPRSWRFPMRSGAPSLPSHTESLAPRATSMSSSRSRSMTFRACAQPDRASAPVSQRSWQR